LEIHKHNWPTSRSALKSHIDARIDKLKFVGHFMVWNIFDGVFSRFTLKGFSRAYLILRSVTWQHKAAAKVYKRGPLVATA